jgi:hypothetical protein
MTPWWYPLLVLAAAVVWWLVYVVAFMPEEKFERLLDWFRWGR